MNSYQLLDCVKMNEFFLEKYQGNSPHRNSPIMSLHIFKICQLTVITFKEGGGLHQQHFLFLSYSCITPLQQKEVMKNKPKDYKIFIVLGRLLWLEAKYLENGPLTGLPFSSLDYLFPYVLTKPLDF